MADGSITISADVDDKQAVKQLEKINRAIEKLENNINKNEAARLPIVEQLREAQQEAVKTYEEIERLKAALAQSEQKTSINGNISADEFSAELEKQQAIKAEIAEQGKLLASQEKASQRLEAADQKLLTTLTQQRQELEAQKEAAGELTQRVTKIQNTERLGNAFAKVEKSIKQSAKTILKWGFGIRAMFSLVRRLRTYITEAVKAYAAGDPGTRANIDGLKASLAGLKASWGAAFAPILNFVTPALQKLISWLQAAANAIAAFFAVLSGKSTYKKAVANTNNLSSGLGGAADNAKELKKQLMGIDELNVMDDTSSTADGGGGGGGAGSTEFEDIQIEEDFINKVNWLKDHLDDILLVAGLIGAAFLAWKLSPLLLLTFSQILAILGTIVAVAYFVYNVFDAWENGVDWDNLIGMIAGAATAAILLGVAFGGTAAAIALIIAAIAIAAVAIKDWIEKGELTTESMFALIAAIMAVGVVISLLTGNWIPLVVAALAAIALAIYKYWGEITEWFNENVGEPIKQAWENIKEWFSNGVDVAIEKWQEFKNKIVSIGNTVKSKFDNIVEKAESLWESIENIAEKLKNAFDFEFKMPEIHLPDVYVEWEETGGLAKFFGVTSIPHLRVKWNAKGGIVDGATLIGAGEAGKEAIVPLERNTQWVSMVAKGLADILFGNGELSVIADHIADIPTAIDRVTSALAGFTMPPLPAVAQGTLVPPNAMNGRYGLNEELSEKLSRFLDAFGGGGSSPINIRTEVMLDKRKVGESVYNYLNERERGSGA